MKGKSAGLTLLCANSNYESAIFSIIGVSNDAKEARFVDSKKAVDLSRFLKDSRNPRFAFSSETRSGIFGKSLSLWLEEIRSAENLFGAYVDVTKKLDKLFKYYEFEEGLYPICNDCTDIERCPLAKRIRKKGKLFHQLPEDIASRIDDHYKRVIKM